MINFICFGNIGFSSLCYPARADGGGGGSCLLGSAPIDKYINWRGPRRQEDLLLDGGKGVCGSVKGVCVRKAFDDANNSILLMKRNYENVTATEEHLLQ